MHFLPIPYTLFSISSHEFSVSQAHQKNNKRRVGRHCRARHYRHGAIFCPRSDTGHILALGFPHDLQKHLVGYIDLPTRKHLFLAALLLLEQFHLSRDIAPIEIPRDILAHGALAA